ncbi:MAG: efflux RND transporter permease subunit, partial [Pirellulaceae bacterium]|nr:efflux RND transporter permease subunit [Pirellulaceae bacterium]
VQDLPDQAERPQVQKQTINEVYPLLQVIVTTDRDDLNAPEAPMRSVAKELRRRLMAVKGVARVSDFPIRKRELLIDVDPDRARQHGLTLTDVHRAVSEAHINLPGGNIDSSDGELNVRSAGQRRSAQEMGALELRPNLHSQTVPLTDIAVITEGYERRLYVGRHNGRSAINLGVLKSDNADSLDVRNNVMAAVEAFQAEPLPDGISVTTAIDATKVIKNRMRVLRNSLLFGVVLVFFVLWLFVGARNSLLAVMGVPFSFLLALVVLDPMGITINALTLFSMVLVSGMIVDDAIIVIENIYRHVERGTEFREAIVKGVSEVALPVLAATLTTAAAFLPMLMMEGVMGVFMAVIPKTVVICLFASLIECFWILPAHYLDFGPRKASARKFPLWFDKQRDRFAVLLKRVLTRPKTLLAASLVMVASSLVMVRTIPVNLFPSDFQAFYVNMVLPANYSIEQTSEATREIETLLSEIRDDGKIEDFTTTVGVTYTPDNQIILRANVSQILIGITDDVANHGDPESLINDVRR